MIKYCQFAGIGLIPWGPLRHGVLARPLAIETGRGEAMKKLFGSNMQPFEEEIVRRVEKVSKGKGWPMSQVALAWASGKVTSPIVGVSSVKRLEEAVIPGHKLTEEDMKYLEEP